MSGSAGTTPAAASPPEAPDVKPNIIRRPSLIMKPAQTPPAGSPPPISGGTLSLTSKEWVIPPRPKPGRKPATDTPPSKRKAQNRAAQRAFRERRAARVNELEDQIKQIEDDHDKDQDNLRAQVTRLEREVEQHRADLASWAERCRRLESELHALRSPRRSHDHVNDKTTQGGDTSVGCGKCTLETRCQCIDDAFDAMGGQNPVGSPTGEKRAHSPGPSSSGKRIKTEPQETLEIDFTAMYSRQPPPSSRAEVISSSSSSGRATVADPCGFCSDGTPCICAEMAAEQEAAAAAQSTAATTRPALTQTHTHRDLPRLSRFTPPPSDGDVSMPSSSVPPPASTANAISNPCANGPGTCAQCQADPNSTLFCKSLAASRSQSASQVPSGGGCCGGRSASGGCCQSTSGPSVSLSSSASTDAVPLPPRTRKTRSSAAAAAAAVSATNAGAVANTTSSGAPANPPRPTTVTLTCADAYTTLSRHPAYERASAEITSWMPKLHASDSPVPSSHYHGSGAGGLKGGNGSGSGVGGGGGGRTYEAPRAAMEIDAANVMAVLRDFDRRFGRS